MADRATWREPPPSFDPSGLRSRLRERAHAGWQRLYDDERDSLVAASIALTDLARLGAPSDLLARAARVVEDEVRHVRVCEHVVGSLGAPPRRISPEQTREPPPGTLAERQARLLIQGFLVGESMSAASFAVARDHASEPLAKWAYTELLRDEARHGKFGADAGAWVLEQLPQGHAATLWADCVGEMQQMEARVGGPFDDEGVERERTIEDLDALEALGLLRGSVICGSYQRAIERWIVPRLRELGVITEGQ